MDELATLLFSRRGAVKAVSEAASISAAAVSQWKRNGIPDRRRELVARVLGVQLTASSTMTEADRPSASPMGIALIAMPHRPGD